MQVYEIRILKEDLGPQTIFQQTYLNDHAAIRSARGFAKDRPCEVWHDLDCIYAGTGNVVRLRADKPGA